MKTRILFIAAIEWLALSYTGRGASFDGSADLLAQPNNFYSFDGSEITWKFSANFLAAFPNAKLQTQVRLAFGEWSSASASAARRSSPRYHWVRSHGAREVYDLRSAATHELGHCLGSQHPDASWFNNNLQRNYRLDGGGDLMEAPPLGGEIMNEGYAPGTLPNSKPNPGIAPGEYWRTLSKDELIFLDYAYDRHLTFVEVAGETPADIIVTAYNLDGQSNSGALGQGGPDASVKRDPEDSTQGRRITAASFTLNANPNLPLGIDPATGSWDVQNQTGKSISRLHIRTEGTSNRQPLLIVLGNGPDNFTDYTPSSAFGVFDFENVGHIFSHSPGASVPNGGIFSIGLQQDVWDWFVTAANAIVTDNTIIPISLLSFSPFYELGLSEAPQSPADHSHALLVQENKPRVLARGLKLVNSDKTTTVSAIAIADVEDLDIDASEVHIRTWTDLVRQGRAWNVQTPAFVLGAGEEFYVLLEGDVGALPEAVRTRGNYVVFAAPGLLDREIFAWAQSFDGQFRVQSLGLINDEPIAAVPPPRLRIFRNGPDVVLAWPEPSTGFILEASPDLSRTAWTPVTIPPVVVGKEKQVTWGTPMGRRFFRLYRP